MTLAALKSFADQYPNDRITLLSRPVAKLLMEGLPSNVSLHTVNLNNYTGLGGLRRLSRELLKEDYDVLVDWHDVLRSKVIRFFFRKARHKVAVIDKGRKERRALTRQKDKVLKPLTPSPERYALVLEAAGFELRLPSCSACLAMNPDKVPAGKLAISTSNRNFVGRQGPGARTVLASPLTVAASAVTGVITDPRKLK